MGLSSYMLEGVVREHCRRSISGSVVQIGRQTIELTETDMKSMLRGYQLPLDDRKFEIDRQTMQVRQTGKQFVSDRAFFGLLGASEVHAVDQSNFEGADIIHDMNRPIDSLLEGIADLILDGSTLDNVHDPAVALLNYNRMLRPGGRLFSINAGKPDVQGAYTGMAAEWFLDYYAVNEYEDCRIYTQLNYGDDPMSFFALDYNWVIEHGRVPPVEHDGWVFSIVMAEKSATSTWDRIPTRAPLRTDAEQAQWLSAVKRFAASDRISHLRTYRPEIPAPPGYVMAM